MREIITDLLVIGAGPAGLAAALSAAEKGVKDIILMDRLEEPGGILQQCIHNGFGLRYFGEELTGPEYAWRFIEQLKKYPQIKLKTGSMVIDMTADKEVIAISPNAGMARYQAKAIILAMGCRERPRGAINIPGSRPAGIYTAGTIQRLMNIEGYLPGREAVIVGSGDIGLIMARRLTLEGVKVRAVFELLSYAGGLQRNIVQCLDDYQIPLYLQHTVTKIVGNRRISAIEAAPVDNDRQPISDRIFSITCDMLVLSVGLIPENELSLKAGIHLDPITNGPVVDSDYQTNVPGIFACGNVVHVHDLVDDVTEESQRTGVAAVLSISSQLASASKIKVQGERNIRSIVPQQIFPDRPTTLYIRALFPERNRVLHIGEASVKLPVIAPGETIRYNVTSQTIGNYKDYLPVSIKEG